MVDVLYGSQPDGLSGAGAQAWSQATSGIGGGFEDNDQFGSVLAH